MWSSMESREVGTNKQETLENALKRLSRFRITFFLQLFPVRLADKIQNFYIQWPHESMQICSFKINQPYHQFVCVPIKEGKACLTMS